MNCWYTVKTEYGRGKNQNWDCLSLILPTKVIADIWEHGDTHTTTKSDQARNTSGQIIRQIVNTQHFKIISYYCYCHDTTNIWVLCTVAYSWIFGEDNEMFYISLCTQHWEYWGNITLELPGNMWKKPNEAIHHKKWNRILNKKGLNKKVFLIFPADKSQNGL